MIFVLQSLFEVLKLYICKKMKNFFSFLFIMPSIYFMGQKITYPETKRIDQRETLFGVIIEDPYRWLEDENAEETKKWVEEQNIVTTKYLETIPFRNKLRERYKELWNYEKMSTPILTKKWLFYYKNNGLQNQSVLYIKNRKTGEEKILLDPNNWSKDGTISINFFVVSHDENYLAYSFSRAGSDWQEIKVVDLNSGKELSDHLQHVKFSYIAWYKKGFFYSAYDVKNDARQLSQKNEYHKVYYHKIGTKQSYDKLVYENKNYPLRNYTVVTTDDEKYAFLIETESTSGNALYFKPLNTKKNVGWTLIADGFKYDYDVIEVLHNTAYILTNEDAPNKKLVAVDLLNPDKVNWKTIIPEREHVLQSVSYASEKWIAHYLEHASSKLYVLSVDGKVEKNMDLGIGSIGGVSVEKHDPVIFLTFSSFAFPTRIYTYNLLTNELKIFWEARVKFDPDNYVTYQIFYPSKDGTMIPMFITHRKDLSKDGERPVLLYGYGGFNISLTPLFRLSIIPFLDAGGVFCVANLRGGGEYGEKWHEAGMKHNKQNVFDDFISAAEYLIKENYTQPQFIGIQGGSNGGLLVGACMTQRPDLFKVALPAVGVMDMLRFHKFTIGWAWINEYGSPDNEDDFHYLLKYSPYHNIQCDVEYPATLITTADHDDRVVPAHSYKFIARLQACQAGENPVLIRIETNAGHGAGKPTSKQIDEITDVMSFLMYNLKMEFHDSY